MKQIKLGFVPAHREPFSEEWAVEMRARTLKALAEIPEVSVVVPEASLTQNGLVRDDSDAEKVIRLFREQEVDGLVIGTMTFGDEISAVTIAERLRALPVLLFGTKEGAFTADGNRRSDSFCGTLSVSSGLYRRKLPFTFVGIVFPEEPLFRQGVADFARTCAIARRFTGARIGMIGLRPERFETCSINEVALIEQFQQRVVQLGLPELYALARGFADTDPAVEEVVQDLCTTGECAGIDREALLRTAKLELALQKFARERELSAMAVSCWTSMQLDYGASSCTAMGRLTDQGVMTACEVDIYGALSMLVQYEASLGQTVPHFIDWTIQHQEDPNRVFMWHCGNAPRSLACAGCTVRLRDHSIMGPVLGKERTVGTSEFQIRPGVVTVNRLVEYDNQFKMLVTVGELEQDERELRGSWSWMRVPDLAQLYRVLVEEGFIHHASMIHGDISKSVIEFCKFAGIDVVLA